MKNKISIYFTRFIYYIKNKSNGYQSNEIIDALNKFIKIVDNTEYYLDNDEYIKQYEKILSQTIINVTLLISSNFYDVDENRVKDIVKITEEIKSNKDMKIKSILKLLSESKIVS